MKALGEPVGLHRPVGARGHSIWIAQKEGRAKDGDDKTDPAILKMFYVDGKKQKIEFVDYMRSLNIVPVSISYELAPHRQGQGARALREVGQQQLREGRVRDIEYRRGHRRPEGAACLLRRPITGASAIRTSWRRSSTRRSGQLSPLPGQLPRGGCARQSQHHRQSAFLTRQSEVPQRAQGHLARHVRQTGGKRRQGLNGTAFGRVMEKTGQMLPFCVWSKSGRLGSE